MYQFPLSLAYETMKTNIRHTLIHSLTFCPVQVLAQIELWTNTAKYPVGVYFLPKKVRNLLNCLDG